VTPASARPPGAPRWLVWPTVGAAAVLALAAFLLWGLGGAGMLLDIVLAWCA
jgi:hypothetical protein